MASRIHAREIDTDITRTRRKEARSLPHISVLPQAQPHAGIYVGGGASHSWTWFVDLLERYGYLRLSFLNERDVQSGLVDLDILIVSGGDTFAVAEALGVTGARAIQQFVEAGGLYIGSCAGAYLPLHSSKDPLRHFNFVQARINNLTRELPPVRLLPNKFSTSYGCSFVFHPVRDEVSVRICQWVPIHGGEEIRVPLYGGPPLQPSDDILPLAHYSGFTPRSLFLTDPGIAEQVFIGKIAACEKPMGQGYLLLLGPHFEHPDFPEGNQIVAKWVEDRFHEIKANDSLASERKGITEGNETCFTKEIWEAFRREISNSRIRAWALERRSLSWQIGAKTYEPEKILGFLETIWKRRKGVRVYEDVERDSMRAGRILRMALACQDLLRRIAQASASEQETTHLAEELFPMLKDMTAGFLTAYFESRRGAEAKGKQSHCVVWEGMWGNRA